VCEECVLILSGGVDSTTLLHYLKYQGKEVHALSFDYNQRHRKELEFAKYWGRRLCKTHLIIPINFPFFSSALTSQHLDVPEGSYTEETQKVTVVPARNLIFLSFAIARAEDLGLSEVYYAAHHNDRAVYPDCREEFVDALSKVSEISTYHGVEVYAPFVKMTKIEIVKLGLELGVDYSRTWSCYVGGDRPCLKCGTCVERTEAFLLNNTKDPHLSDEEWRSAVKIYKECGENE